VASIRIVIHVLVEGSKSLVRWLGVRERVLKTTDVIAFAHGATKTTGVLATDVGELVATDRLLDLFLRMILSQTFNVRVFSVTRCTISIVRTIETCGGLPRVDRNVAWFDRVLCSLRYEYHDRTHPESVE
jgi:hypothetical protein